MKKDDNISWDKHAKNILDKPIIEVINDLPVRTLLIIANKVCTDYASANYRRNHNKALLQHSVRKAWSTGNRQEQILDILEDEGYVMYPIIEKSVEPLIPVVCEYCGTPMSEGSCCLPSVFVAKDGTEVPAYRWGEEPEHGDYQGKCGDCACGIGQYHHVGCDMERCPVCDGQALYRTCGHIRKFENGETTWK